MDNLRLRRSQKNSDSNPENNVGTKPTSKRAQLREQRQGENKEPKKTLWIQINIIPIWLRLILITVLLAVVAAIGLRFGYSYVGDGNPEDVLKKETWTHILDIIKGKE